MLRDARQFDKLVLRIRDGRQGVRFDNATPQLERVRRRRVNVYFRFPVSCSASRTSQFRFPYGMSRFSSGLCWKEVSLLHHLKSERRNATMGCPLVILPPY